MTFPWKHQLNDDKASHHEKSKDYHVLGNCDTLYFCIHTKKQTIRKTELHVLHSTHNKFSPKRLSILKNKLVAFQKYNNKPMGWKKNWTNSKKETKISDEHACLMRTIHARAKSFLYVCIHKHTLMFFQHIPTFLYSICIATLWIFEWNHETNRQYLIINK